ncbi:hypothetical protein FDA94_19505 [Herbidospora galbida]|uniref:Uncharacterized protein n=1 Tax=Herbidospora galbida TaxID=2575442 RepID=A0A4U3MG94_9ACTN|nr:hypothetical protein FDA94_19505 [Herbidospora galbida]
MTSMWSSPEHRTERCASCDTEREFTQPPCEEGHEVCPEWSCVTCGSALFFEIGSQRAPQAASGRPRPVQAVAAA